MHARDVFAIAGLALAGCATAEEPAVRPAYSNRYCADIARHRVMDARANGIDPALDPRIFADAYASCVTQAQQRLPTP